MNKRQKQVLQERFNRRSAYTWGLVEHKTYELWKDGDHYLVFTRRDRVVCTKNGQPYWEYLPSLVSAPVQAAKTMDMMGRDQWAEVEP